MENQAKAAKKRDAGQLDIGHYTSLSTGPLRDAIEMFTTLRPLVDVNLNAHSRTDLLSLLDRGSIDVAIMLGESKGQDYAHMSLWSDRIMVAFPKVHPLSDRDFVYWIDLKNERFLISIRDPRPELEDMLLSKLAAPGDRRWIKSINGKREDMLSMVGNGGGIGLICESAAGNVVRNVVYREVRDGNGPTRVGLVAYWRRNNDNPALNAGKFGEDRQQAGAGGRLQHHVGRRDRGRDTCRISERDRCRELLKRFAFLRAPRMGG